MPFEPDDLLVPAKKNEGAEQPDRYYHDSAQTCPFHNRSYPGILHFFHL